MRLALASLIAAAGLAPLASAQTEPTQVPTAPPPAPSAPVAPPSALLAPPAPVAGAMPPATDAAPSAMVAPAPEAPPAPPTDPTAIELIGVLETVCVPAVDGGDLAKLGKPRGYRKSGDNYSLKRSGYQFTILAPGSNPNQCHVDIVHPVDPAAPAAPLVVALHNWAAVSRGWTLYRNDKSTAGTQELTTRSWEHDDGPKHEALVITTFRHADGTPSQRAADTSTVIYSATKTAG